MSDTPIFKNGAKYRQQRLTCATISPPTQHVLLVLSLRRQHLQIWLAKILRPAQNNVNVSSESVVEKSSCNALIGDARSYYAVRIDPLYLVLNAHLSSWKACYHDNKMAPKYIPGTSKSGIEHVDADFVVRTIYIVLDVGQFNLLPCKHVRLIVGQEYSANLTSGRAICVQVLIRCFKNTIIIMSKLARVRGITLQK